jgi:hypothetical protein
LGDFRRKNWRFSSKTNVMIIFLYNVALFGAIIAICSAIFLWNFFKS